MIETTIKVVDGVEFITNIRQIPPYDYEHGVRVEFVRESLSHNRDIGKVLKALGLRRVGYQAITDTYIYSSFPVNFIWLKILHAFIRIYWLSLWWLYNNARMFKQIPQGDILSWRYFTPYCWYLSIKKKLKVKTGLKISAPRV